MPATSELLITACQIDITLGDTDYNAQRICNIIKQHCRAKGACNGNDAAPPQLFVFPECALTGYGFEDVGDLRTAAMQCETHLNKILQLCVTLDVYAIVGYVEFISANKMYNSAALISPENGGAIHNYRKMHLPNVGLDNLKQVKKSKQGYPVFDLAFARVGLLICFDHGFPETSRVLALNGAEVIIAIVNWGEGLSGPDVVQARAIDNGVTYMALNRVGQEAGDTYIGQSSLVDDNGEVIFRLGSHEQIVSANVQINSEGGRNMTAHPLNQRRPASYHDLIRPLS